MSRNQKDTKRINLGVPNDLIEQADLLAEAMGLDRYDVIRVALSQGLAVVRFQHELAANPARYVQAMKSFAAGEEGSEEALVQTVEQGMSESVKKQVQRRAQKKST